MAKVDPITVSQPGVKGVNVDAESTLLDDAELQLAQNAYHDPTSGHRGALRKRPGLRKFNATTPGHSILGGTPMAVRGTGGAPTPPPGDGGDPPPDPEPSPTIFGDPPPSNPLMIVGLVNNTAGNANGSGWYASEDGIASVATAFLAADAPPGPLYAPSAVLSFPPTANFPGLYGRPTCVIDGYVYYMAAYDQVSGNSASNLLAIRKLNGAQDLFVAHIPVSALASAGINGAATAQRSAIMAMIANPAGTVMWIAVKDKAAGQTASGDEGRIFQLLTASNALTEINVSTDTATPNPAALGVIPYSLGFFDDKVFFGGLTLSSSEVPVNITQPVFVETKTEVETELNYVAELSVAQVATGFLTFPATSVSGQVLFCCGARHTSPVDFPLIYAREAGAVSAVTPDPSVWHEIFWAGSPASTLFGQSASDYGQWTSMVEFGGKLYAAYMNGTGHSYIMQYTPDFTVVDGNGAWAPWLAVGATSNTGWAKVLELNSSVPLELFVAGSTIYAIGNQLAGGATHKSYSSTNGSSWTDISSNLPAFSDQSRTLPILHRLGGA